MDNNYTIKDVLRVGNPLDDGGNFECNKCESLGFVDFDKGVDDSYCKHCGNWQKSREYSSPEEIGNE